MGAASRVIRLQHVMSQISTLFPKDSFAKLTATVNYPKWETMLVECWPHCWCKC